MSDCVKREVRELGLDRGNLWSCHHVSQGFSAPHGTDLLEKVPCEHTQGWNNSHDLDTTELIHSFVISAALVHPLALFNL